MLLRVLLRRTDVILRQTARERLVTLFTSSHVLPSQSKRINSWSCQETAVWLSLLVLVRAEVSTVSQYNSNTT